MKRRLIELSALNRLPLWIALATLAVLIYLGAAWTQTGRVGFPLDDAWIHQTYARNLGQQGEFSFTPGIPSAGSTAPLWSALLSVGYFLHLPYLLWAYSLGIAFLGLSGFSMARLGQRLFPDKLWLGPTIGLALVTEWHLIWAAASGMETIMFVWLSILLVERYAGITLPLTPSLKGRGETFFRSQTGVWERKKREGIWKREKGRGENPPPFEGGVRGGWKFLQLGLTGGLLILVRPEGIGLIGLIGLHLIATALIKKSPDDQTGQSPLPPRSPFDRLRASSAHLLALGVGALLPLLPYLAFNYSLTGLPFPNTFYAKQQEYAILLSNIGLLQRWLGVAGVTLIGGQALLVPGLLKALWVVVSGRRSAVGGRRSHSLLALIALWWFSHLTLYAIRLPVTYQHGRYEMPTIPWLLLLGVWGVTFLISPGRRTLWVRVLSKTWFISLILAFPLFIALGAQGYANDVEFIETEMVKTAQWLRENTGPETIIAAHDIGAIGYFAQRPLVDLAGLITPEVTPFIRDEAALLAFSQEQGAGYLVTFPDWYPLISSSLFQVYSTNSSWAIEAGYGNMSVYRLERGR